MFVCLKAKQIEVPQPFCELQNISDPVQLPIHPQWALLFEFIFKTDSTLRGSKECF